LVRSARRKYSGPLTYLNALIKPTGTLRYAFHAAATGASLTGTKNPVQVTLTIGDDRGLTSVAARIR
jgi:hypothetical protein